MQFAVNEQKVKVASVNPRAEKHGEENHLAADVKIQYATAHSVLDHFDPKLRPLLFRRPAVGEQQGLPIDGNDGLTSLRSSQLGEISWDEDFPGYVLKIARGAGMAPSLVISNVELRKFRFQPMDGGTVIVTFNAIVREPTDDVMGALCGMIQEDVTLTLEAPKAKAESKPKAKTPASHTKQPSPDDAEADKNKHQADAFATALASPLRAFIFASDPDSVWAGITAADAAMAAHVDTGERYDADACNELTDLQLDMPIPEHEDDGTPTGTTTSVRTMLAELGEPGYLCELLGSLPTEPVGEAGNSEALGDDDVDVRPAKLRNAHGAVH